MPKAFTDAIKKGAKVRTVSLPGGKYIHVAYLNGKEYKGEVKTDEKKSKKLSKEEFRKKMSEVTD